MTKHDYATTAVGLTLAIGILLTGCASSDGPGAFSTPAPPPSLTEYAIQPGDTLSVQFYYHRDHNQNEVLVRDDGKILLPIGGEVNAAGLTPSQLSTELAKRYSSTLKDPAVSVSIKSLNQYLVWVGGEVNKPGFVQYRPGLTAVQALFTAGGLRDTAAPEECVLLQKVGMQDYRSSKVDLAKVLYEGDVKADLILAPKDVLFVPKSGIAKANVWVDQHIIRLIPIRFGYGF